MISSAQKYHDFLEQEKSLDFCPEHKTREEHDAAIERTLEKARMKIEEMLS